MLALCAATAIWRGLTMLALTPGDATRLVLLSVNPVDGVPGVAGTLVVGACPDKAVVTLVLLSVNPVDGVPGVAGTPVVGACPDNSAVVLLSVNPVDGVPGVAGTPVVGACPDNSAVPTSPRHASRAAMPASPPVERRMPGLKSKLFCSNFMFQKRKG